MGPTITKSEFEKELKQKKNTHTVYNIPAELLQALSKKD